MKVLFIDTVPSPYRINFYNELSKNCELTVIFEKDKADNRDKSWLDYDATHFKIEILHGIKAAADMSFAPQIVKRIKRNLYDFIFVCNHTSPTGIVATRWMNLRKIAYAIEIDGGFAKSGKGVKEKFKRRITKGAECYFSTGKSTNEYFILYGATPDKLVKYPFTSIYEKDIVKTPMSKEDKAALREKLGIKEDKVVLSVGQFIHRKGYDVLLEAAKDISKDVGIYIVGGEPTEEYLKVKEDRKLDHVHFVGFKKKDELAEYYLASDLFVLPTREDIWGLVINEAMAYGLPVITTDRCVAGLELVENGENGYIVPIEDAGALAGKINLVINDANALGKMGICSAKKIEWYTFESMAKVHIDYMKGYGGNGKNKEPVDC